MNFHEIGRVDGGNHGWTRMGTDLLDRRGRLARATELIEPLENRRGDGRGEWNPDEWPRRTAKIAKGHVGDG